MSDIFFFLLFIVLFKSSDAQDKLYLRDNTLLTGSIISADSQKVIFRNSIRPDGPDYIYEKKEINRLEYASGLIVNYFHRYYQSAIGISSNYGFVQYDPASYHVLEKLDNKQLSLSGIFRGNFFGVKIDIGYAKLQRILEYEHQNHYYPPFASTYSYNSVNANASFGMISFRLNSTKTLVNPYLFFSFGFESFSHKNFSRGVSFSRLGFGIEVRVKKKYLIESELGFGFWNENIADDSGSSGYHTSLGLNIHRILYEKYY